MTIFNFERVINLAIPLLALSWAASLPCPGASLKAGQKFACAEVGPKNSAMAVEYKLRVKSGRAGELDIDGFQTLKRYAVRLEENRAEILVYFDSVREENVGAPETYKLGDLLFKLKRPTSKKSKSPTLIFEKMQAVLNPGLRKLKCR